LLKKELLKIKLMPERIYITHLKPQFYKVIKKEIKRLNVNNLTLLKEGDILQV